MKWRVGTKIGAGFGLALLIFVIVGIVSYQNVRKQIEDAGWVTHTNEVIATLAMLLSALQDAETGQRGYIITGDENYLAPHTAGAGKAATHHRQLSQLVADNPVQSARAAALAPLLSERLASLEDGIELRRKQDFAAAQAHVVSGRGKRAMDEVRQITDTMAQEEQRLLAERLSAADAAAKSAVLTIVLGTIAALLIAGVAGFLITRNVAGPMRALTNAAERITLGDLGATVDVGDREDEVGMLGRAFQRMVVSLRSMAGIAERIADGDLRSSLTPQSPQDALGHAFVKMIANLRTQIGSIVEGATVLGSAATEIVASTAQLASGASESAAAVSETTTTVEEIRQTAQMASQKARSVSADATDG